MTPFAIRWRLYLPEAIQMMHVVCAGSDAWCVPLRAPVSVQMQRLRTMPAADLSAL